VGRGVEQKAQDELRSRFAQSSSAAYLNDELSSSADISSRPLPGIREQPFIPNSQPTGRRIEITLGSGNSTSPTIASASTAAASVEHPQPNKQQFDNPTIVVHPSSTTASTATSHTTATTSPATTLMKAPEGSPVDETDESSTSHRTQSSQDIASESLRVVGQDHLKLRDSLVLKRHKSEDAASVAQTSSGGGDSEDEAHEA
jgi:hypothetical protein